MSRKIVMLKDALGASNETGSDTRFYALGEVLPLAKPWQVKLADGFLGLGWAIEHTEVDIETKDAAPPSPKGGRPAARAKPAKKPLDILTKMGKKIRD